MRAALALAVITGAPAVARADQPRNTPAAIEIDREVAPPGRTEHGFDGGAPIDGWGLTLGFGWLDRPIVLRSAGLLSEPVAHRETLSLGGAVALGDTVVVDARLPFAHQIGARLALAGDPRPLDRWVPGDLRLGARLRVAGTLERAAFVRGELSLPTGDDHDFAGDSSWTLAWMLIGRVTVPAGIVIAAAGGIELRGHEIVIGDRLVGDELHASVGIAVPVPPVHPLWCVAEQVKLTGELVGILGDNVAGLRGPSPVEARIGLVTRPIEAITLGVRIGAGLSDQIGAPRWRATVELTYQGRGRLMSPSASPDKDDRNDEELEGGDAP